MRFKKAKPIWLKGKSEEINIGAIFTTHIVKQKGKQYKLILSGATLYRIYINQKFIHYGPARGPHGYARIDEIDITRHLAEGQNHISIEVAGYKCPTYYTIQGTSFLCAEIVEDEKVVAYTGENFSVKQQKDRLQKVSRYSFQRSFNEVWHLDNKRKKEEFEEECIEILELEIDFIPRDLEYPELKYVEINTIVDYGKCLKIPREGNGNFVKVKEDTFVSFPEEELEDKSYYELQQLKFESIREADCEVLNKDRYCVWEMEINNNGFIHTRIKVKEDAKILIIFDELLEEGKINYNRWATNNIVTYELKASNDIYELQSFETYGFKYIGIVVLEGSIEVNKIGLVEYSYPHYNNTVLRCKDNDIQKIFDAAIQTYRQNTLDVFMDCPTRERAGWLCDSYFTSQSAYLFSGDYCVEKVFLENFVKAKYFTGVPEGMLPMCYPADHFNGNFIPQWGMWYIIELEQYLKRNKSADKNIFKKICYNMIQYLKKFINLDGLLEKLEGWNFIEWSVANEWVQDVNYPTNMLYYKVLNIIGKLYEDNDLLEEANKLKEVILEQSFDGEFFRDHSVRENEKLMIQDDKSEVCQYYAFFTGIASEEDEKFKTLVERILTVFGPGRKEKGELDEIGYANAFIGNYLRCILLIKWKKYNQVLEECIPYFYKMANRTGTLWENDNTVASLNHGFASYVGVIIIQAMFGIISVNYGKQVIEIDDKQVVKVDGELGIQTLNGEIYAKNEDGVVSIKVPQVYKVIKI